jgi:hypothetical protein
MCDARHNIEKTGCGASLAQHKLFCSVPDDWSYFEGVLRAASWLSLQTLPKKLLLNTLTSRQIIIKFVVIIF